MTFTHRNHLVITPSLAATGAITPINARLADHLRTFNRPFLLMKNVEVLYLHDGSADSIHEAIIPVAQIVAAHEYVDTGGDAHLKAMAKPTQESWVKTHISSVPGLVLEGAIAEGSLEWQTNWIILGEPTPSIQSDGAARHAKLIEGLSYLIVNRAQVGALLKFSR